MSTIGSVLCPTRLSTERKLLGSGLHDDLRGHEGVHRAVVGEDSRFIEAMREGVTVAEQARGEGGLVVTGDGMRRPVLVHPDHFRPNRNGQHLRGEREVRDVRLRAWGGWACPHLGRCCRWPSRAREGSACPKRCPAAHHGNGASCYGTTREAHRLRMPGDVLAL